MTEFIKQMALTVLVVVSFFALALMLLILFQVIPAANPEDWPLSRRLLNVAIAGAFFAFAVSKLREP